MASFNSKVTFSVFSSFKDLDYINLKSQQNAVIFDVKSFLDKNIVDARL